MPLKIFQFLYWTDAAVGGPARASIDLSSALAARGHEVTYAAVDDRGVPKDWPRGERRPGTPTLISTPCRYLPAKTLPPAAMRRLVDAMKGHDLLHVHGVWDVCNIQLARAAQRLGIPYFVSVRGMLDDWCMAQKGLKKRLMLSAAVTRWLEDAAAVHLTAEAELDQAKKHFPKGRGVVIPNLLDVAPFRALPGPEIARQKFEALRTPGPKLLFLSRIHVKKGMEPLLRALKLLRDKGIPATLLVAGSGEAEYVASLKTLVDQLELNAAVAFVGLVIDREKLSLYEAADIFVLPTSQENFGFVFVEALACGTPVVTTKGVDIWPELEESGGSVICTAEPADLARTLEGLLAQPQALPEMGRKGRAWVFDALDPSKVLDRFESMYALGARPAGRAPQRVASS